MIDFLLLIKHKTVELKVIWSLELHVLEFWSLELHEFNLVLNEFVVYHTKTEKLKYKKRFNFLFHVKTNCCSF